MSVRAKFKVTSIKQTEDWSRKNNCLYTVELSPVYGDGDPNHENTAFWQATPSGKIELGTINEMAAAQFLLGAEYYIDFTKA